MEIGEIIEGQISGVKNYGVFIKFNDTFGFCHISNLSKDFVSNVEKLFKIGQNVKAKIIQIDENNRINLSIKDVEQKRVRNKSETIQNRSKYVSNIIPYKPEKMSFDDMLNQFLKSSDDKIKSINNRTKKHTKR